MMYYWRALMNRKLTAIIEREDDGYVALCPESGCRQPGRYRR